MSPKLPRYGMESQKRGSDQRHPRDKEKGKWPVPNRLVQTYNTANPDLKTIIDNHCKLYEI